MSAEGCFANPGVEIIVFSGGGNDRATTYVEKSIARTSVLVFIFIQVGIDVPTRMRLLPSCYGKLLGTVLFQIDF